MLHLVTFHGITGFARRHVITWNVLVIDLVITQNVNGVLNIVITQSVCLSIIVITRDVAKNLNQEHCYNTECS